MNVSWEWKLILTNAGHECLHWSEVGDPRADDVEIVGWAAANHHVVFTHDLDFGTILYTTRAFRPSVIQIRGKDISPDALGSMVVSALIASSDDLQAGALLTIEPAKHRVRVLPLRDPG